MTVDYMEVGEKYMIATAQTILVYNTPEERMEAIDRLVVDGVLFQLYTVETRRG